MTFSDIRKLFLDYFEKNGHVIVPSASLIPNDPTVMFTVAGMVPWKGILKGTEPAFAPRVADSQKCIRAGGKHNDLEDVGFDGRHHTFFEMLGNWSFGDYFKEGAIEYSWELLTKVLKLDPARIVVTTHTSDDEATALWKKIAAKDAIRLGDKSNWWSEGDTGPCGPCTEMFYDFGAALPGGLPGSASEDGGRFVEIWNDVFMQYDRAADGSLSALPKQNVDTGAGLERWASIMQGVTDNYDTDLFVALKAAVSDVTGVAESADNRPSFKVITDHLRAVGFALADGVVPSNEGRGYVIRRILRRAMRHGQVLGHRGALLSSLYPALIEQMGAAYPELARESAHVVGLIRREEDSFAEMLQNGMKLIEVELPKINNKIMNGETAFKLYDTYGFPLDLTEMILRERGIAVDVPGFERAMAEQKERSRADTKGTKTLWESRTDLPATDDHAKYFTDYTMTTGGESTEGKTVLPVQSKIIAILKNGEFVNAANAKDEVEIALDKTPFYATMGGQVGDTGWLVKSQSNSEIMDVNETFPISGLVVHKGVLESDVKVGDSVWAHVNDSMREQTARAHTAAHLLQAALRQVLGHEVEQRGSKVSPDSVRFDFSYPVAMTAEQKSEVERLVNEWIDADLPVETKHPATVAEAEKMGAMALFGEKYEDGKIRMVCVGANENSPVSMELCGGTHITHTIDIGRAKINSEKSIASGIRRIKMSVGDMAK